MPKKKVVSQIEKLNQTPVENYTHDHNTRPNIPTQEMSHLSVKKQAKKVYAYDPSLDPQLQRTGKDERKELEVDTTPIYIHEFISPKGIIDKLRNPDGEFELRDYGMFHDSFRDEYQKDFAKQVEYYQHDNKWTNRMILWDSLLAMNSLLEKEWMSGKVQCVYIDPPYGIKFGSNWQVSTGKRDVKDWADDNLTRDVEQVKAFRDTWELGIHSYLTYLRDRLITARELLTESGSCFVQISDENLHLVRNLMDEVFGSENFVALIQFRTASTKPTELLSWVCDFIVWYWKNRKSIKYRELYTEKVDIPDYEKYEYNGEVISVGAAKKKWLKIDVSNIFSLFHMPASVLQTRYEFVFMWKRLNPVNWWRISEKSMYRLAELWRLVLSGDSLKYKRRMSDFPYEKINATWVDLWGEQNKSYVVQTATDVIRRCVLMTTDPWDIVVDPTCGSGTTATVCEQRGRRWITMDTSRVALALARTRLMSTIFPYYKLKDESDMRAWFYYKIVPHITLKSLANDEPAEDEILYDQPLEDKKVIRVSWPFTVEWLAPHRVDDQWDVQTTEDFAHKVVENLRKYGIQTWIKAERLVFETLDIISNPLIQASWDYLENGKIKKAGVLIWPEYWSIDDDMINDAIKQTSKHIDLLIVAGVSFTGSAFTTSDTAFDNPNFKCIKVKINPDLAMDDLLKKTSSGNIFMTFWEPDISVEKTSTNLIQITVHGVDIYDATTGQIRKWTDNEIACRFIDANYNETSFFVTHAYFTWWDKPFEKLRKTLKAEINEEAWEQIYTTVSAPISVPSTGKIAIKVINHYWDEVMKVIEVK